MYTVFVRLATSRPLPTNVHGTVLTLLHECNRYR